MPQDPSMSSPIRYDLGADRIVTVTFDAPGAPVNTMTEAWIKAFHETLDRLEAERENYDGVILASAKKTFFAGAELKEVLKFTPADGPRVFAWLEGVKRDMRRLEKLGKPMELHVYDAQHAFCNDLRPDVYNAEAAQQAWQRAVAFARSHTA